MNNQQEGLEEQILRNLIKTGFINELHIANKLNNANWKTSLNQSFQDIDTNTSREIDIVARKAGKTKCGMLSMSVHLVIECKKIEKYPWVIISNQIENSLYFHLYPGWSIIHAGEKYMDGGGIFPPRLIDEHFMRSNSTRIGSAFHDAFKDSTEASQIFKAFMSACKAAVYKSKLYDIDKEWSAYKIEDPTRLDFFHPVVVVDGPLFEAFLDLKNELTVKRADWVPITYRHTSPQYGDDTLFHCDIVTFNYFDKYLNSVENWLTKMSESCGSFYKEKYLI